jgi:hypothetical protein
MSMSKSDQISWTKYMIDYFIDNGFSIYVSTDDKKLQFEVKNIFGLSITFSNLFGFASISFDEQESQVVFMSYSEIEFVEENLYKNDFSSNFENLEKSDIPKKYKSEKLPCVIYAGVKTNPYGFRFYNQDDSLDDTEIFKLRKIVFEQILNSLKQMK